MKNVAAFGLAAVSLLYTSSARATALGAECPVDAIGLACDQGGTCISATCCDHPDGCTVDVDAGSMSSGSGGSSGSTSSGGSTGTGTPRACAICELTGAPWCSPAEVGQACGDGGTCEGSSGGGGPATGLDGGTTNAYFAFTTCQSAPTGDDGGSGSSSGSTSSGGASSSTSSGGTSSGGTSSGGTSSGGTSSGGTSSGGSTSSSSSSSTTGGGTSSGGSSSGGLDAGVDGGTADDGDGGGNAGCVCSVTPRNGSWSVSLLLAWFLALASRRRSRG